MGTKKASDPTEEVKVGGSGKVGIQEFGSKRGAPELKRVVGLVVENGRKEQWEDGSLSSLVHYPGDISVI